ncbi:MAG: methyltransferase domain-containing protein, partial [Actinobacteria bacterium]|nr:methyltransferase domain-containing protein [Actinomycetota bacterium]
RSCGLSQLVDPIPPERLYSNYHWLSAWKWNPHADGLLNRIEAMPDLGRDARVLEVGSNDGSFLLDLRKRGYSNLLGLEPAEDARSAAEANGIRTLSEYFTRETAQTIVQSFGQCDLFVARQVIEHVPDLREFGEAMRVVLRPGARVLVEVPDFGFNQAAPDYSAMWEEHVNHFTQETLARYLGGLGIALDECYTEQFSGQILIAFGRYTGAPLPSSDPTPELTAGARRFRDRWPGFQKAILEYLAEERRAGRRIAVYGAGCRSSTLINFTGIGEYLDCAVDDQIEKQGRYMPGSHLAVVPGDALEDGAVDTCLLAVNAENEDAVIARRSAFVERGGRFVSLHPPSPRLPAFWTEI